MTFKEKKSEQGYKIPRLLPPHLFIAGVLLIYFGAPYETGGGVHHNVWGAIIAALGIVIAVAASQQFRKAQTTIFPGDKPTQMVTTGIFRYTRNPMYLGMVLVLAGVWSFTGGFSPMAVIVAFIMIIQKRYIAMEEQHMLAEFGEEYLQYCLAVRRWI